MIEKMSVRDSKHHSRDCLHPTRYKCIKLNILYYSEWSLFKKTADYFPYLSVNCVFLSNFEKNYA